MERYDAVIVGARCAGSTAAIALARGGWDVLLVDKDEFPSDTISTHGLWPNTIARLEELGAWQLLLDRHTIRLSGHRIRILGHELTGDFTPVSGFTKAAGPRRRVLDQALLDTAIAAGAEARFGEKVTGLIGTGTEADPVRGVETEGGGSIEARWVLGADGRVSTIASQLGLEKTEPLSGEMGMLYSYWTGLPETEYAHLDGERDAVFNWAPAEDDIDLLIYNCPPEVTRGDRETRERAFHAAIRRFPATIDPEAIDAGEMVSEVQPVPETMLRGFYHRPTGPGWALIGDAGHFKHPATAQGISDAIEQGLYVANALMGQGPGLDTYPAWRDKRAAEFYEWSFTFARFPRESGKVMFAAMEREPEAAQHFRDTFSRLSRPRSDLLTKERLGRWFAEAEASKA